MEINSYFITSFNKLGLYSVEYTPKYKIGKSQLIVTVALYKRQICSNMLNNEMF